MYMQTHALLSIRIRWVQLNAPFKSLALAEKTEEMVLAIEEYPGDQETYIKKQNHM